MDKPRILFIAHSLGGIVVRRILCQQYQAFRDKRVGLLLVASPSFGSGLANIGAAVPFLRWTLLSGLARSSQELVELDRNFHRLKEAQLIPHLKGYNLIEARGPLFLGLGRQVVNTESASRYFDSEMIPGTDHVSIKTPASVSEQVHIKVKHLAQSWGLLTRQRFARRLRELNRELDAQRAMFASPSTIHPDRVNEVFIRIRNAACALQVECDAPDWLDDLQLHLLINAELQGNYVRPYHNMEEHILAEIRQRLEDIWNELKPHHS